jgi:HD superfamily phosphohydrolase
MDNDISKALNGELDEKGLADLEAQLSDEGKKVLKEALAFKAKKNDEKAKAEEAEKLRLEEEAKLEALRKEREAEEGKLNSTKESVNQFRTEQISKAKVKFFEDYHIPAEEQSKYEDMFKKVDSNKVDPELIYKDFEVAHVALNPEAFLQAKKEREEMEKNAALANQGAAGSQSTPPSGNEKKVFSEKDESLAKNAGITNEAAKKINEQGFHRILG